MRNTFSTPVRSSGRAPGRRPAQAVLPSLMDESIDESSVMGLYAVANGEMAWNLALERLCASTLAVLCVMATFDRRDRGLLSDERAMQSGRLPSRDWLATHHRDDPWLDELFDKPVGHLVNTENAPVTAHPAAQRFHRQFWEAHGLGGAVYVKLAEDAFTTTLCVLARGRDFPGFADDEELLLLRYFSHWQLALSVQRRRERAEINVFLSRRMLETGDRTMIAFTGDGRLLTSNRLGRDFIESGKYLIDRNGLLIGSTKAGQAALRQMLLQLAQTPGETDRPQVLRLPGTGGMVALCSIWTLPAPTEASDDDHETHEPVWLLTALEPGHEYVPDADYVRETFDLTDAESRIATLVAGGYSLKEIAMVQSVSINTVRGQLAAVMEKTGTGRQAELVALVLQRAQS